MYCCVLMLPTATFEANALHYSVTLLEKLTFYMMQRVYRVCVPINLYYKSVLSKMAPLGPISYGSDIWLSITPILMLSMSN